MSITLTKIKLKENTIYLSDNILEEGLINIREEKKTILKIIRDRRNNNFKNLKKIEDLKQKEIEQITNITEHPRNDILKYIKRDLELVINKIKKFKFEHDINSEKINNHYEILKNEYNNTIDNNHNTLKLINENTNVIVTEHISNLNLIVDDINNNNIITTTIIGSLAITALYFAINNTNIIRNLFIRIPQNNPIINIMNNNRFPNITGIYSFIGIITGYLLNKFTKFK
jgi:hypothetical protein